MTGLRDFDRVSTAAITSLPPSISPVMRGLSLIGEPVVVLTVGAAGFVSAVARGHNQEQLAFIFGGIAFSLCTFLKLILKRRRPHGRIVKNFGINSYSFPSGHAYGTVIFYGLFALIDTRYLSSPWDAAFSLLVALLIFLIGVSRVYNGVHFPSDVVAGWFLGCVSLTVINWLLF